MCSSDLTDTLTILTSGNVSITADAAGDNMTFDLTTTGVTAAVYGSSTIVPVFTVDSRGRLTSVTNVSISAPAPTNSVVYISTTAPTGTANGTLWWNSNDGTLYINYGDGDSNQWIVTNPFISAVANVSTTDTISPFLLDRKSTRLNSSH